MELLQSEHLPLSGDFVISFLLASLDICSAAKYGVLTGQYYMFNIIMSRNDFTFRVAGLVHYMQTKGHDSKRMLLHVQGSLCQIY